MDSIRQDLLVEFALSEIDQLLNKFDHCGQIESVLPLLLQHRRTLARLRHALLSSDTTQEPDHERWLDDLLTTYRQLGGQVPHATVYRKMKELRTKAGRSWPEHAEEIIRQTLQAHNAESPQYHDGLDLFRMVRPGLWRLRDHDIH